MYTTIYYLSFFEFGKASYWLIHIQGSLIWFKIQIWFKPQVYNPHRQALLTLLARRAMPLTPEVASSPSTTPPL
jgi:hypothetical protein